MLKVLAIEFPEWMVEGAKGPEMLGEFAHQDDAVAAIWRHLVQTRQRHAYLLFKRHPLLRCWRLMPSVFWGTLQGGLPKMYQEELESSMAKRASRLYKA